MEEIKKNHSGDGILAIVIIALLLVVDQTIKVLVKTHMCLGDSIHITDWFQILFIENNGMAYGMELLGGKLVLSLFRIVAISVLAYYLYKEVKRNANRLGNVRQRIIGSYEIFKKYVHE